MKKNFLIGLVSMFICFLSTDKQHIPSSEEKAVLYIQKLIGIERVEALKYIVIISDYGCEGCDRTFAKETANKVNSNKFFFVIYPGIQKKFFCGHYKNVMIERYINEDGGRRSMFYYTKVIFLEKAKIIRIMTPRAMEIEDQIVELQKLQ